MRNIAYQGVSNYIMGWEDIEERDNAMEIVTKLDDADIILFGKPSSIAVAFLYYANDKRYIDFISKFKTKYNIKLSQMSVRSHLKKIRASIGERKSKV